MDSPRVSTLAVFNTNTLYAEGERYTTDGTVVELYEQWAEHFATIELCAPVSYADNAHDITLREDHLAVHELPTWSSGWELHTTALFGLARAINRLFRTESDRWDAVVISDSGPFGVIAYVLAGYHDVPRVLYLRGDAVYEIRDRHREGIEGAIAHGWSLVLERIIRHMVGHSGVITSGTALAERYANANPDIQPTVSTVVSADQIAEEPRQPPDDPVRLLFAGRLVELKGVTYLIDALEQLSERAEREYELTIAGDGPERDALERQTENAGVTERVQFVGFVERERMDELYRTHDVFVLPSLSEGTPKVISEAFARGIPVVGSDVGGIPSMAEDGESGVLVLSGDGNALANGIEATVSRGDYERLSTGALVAASEMTVDTQVKRLKTTIPTKKQG